jgi:hypothetical protein
VRDVERDAAQREAGLEGGRQQAGAGLRVEAGEGDDAMQWAMMSRPK